MSNLEKFIALEKLIHNVGHGTLHLELQIRAGKIVGVTTSGNKKTLYNSSDKDINNNQTAMEYVVKRIMQQVDTKTTGELVFKVNSNSANIRSVEVESKQTIK